MLTEARYRLLAFAALAMLAVEVAFVNVYPFSLNWDFQNFYDTGRRVASGRIVDIYNSSSLVQGKPPSGPLNFLGTPISAWLYAPLSWLSYDAALRDFKLQSTICYLAALALLYWFTLALASPPARERWRITFLFALVAVMYQPLWTIYMMGGQTTPVVLLLSVTALVAFVGEWMYSAAFLMVAAVLIKPVYGTALLFLLCAGGTRFLVGGVLALAAAGAASVALCGWQMQLRFLQQMALYAPRVFDWRANSSLYVWLHRLPASAVLSNALRAAAVATVLFLLFRARRDLKEGPALRHVEFLLAVFLALLSASTIFEHYLVMLLPFVMYLLAMGHRLSRRASMLLALFLVLAACGHFKISMMLGRLVQPTSSAALLSVELLKSGPLIVTLIFLWTCGQEWIATYGAVAREATGRYFVATGNPDSL